MVVNSEIYASVAQTGPLALRGFFERTSVLTALFIIGSVPLSVSAWGASSPSGSGALTSCLKAASDQQSVHVKSVTSGLEVSAAAKTRAAVSLTTDALKASGIQKVSFTQGAETGHEVVELVGNVGYFEGDAFTLTNFNGFSSAAVKGDAKTWISVSKSSPAFASLTSSLTVSSVVAQLNVPSPVSVATGKKVNGNPAVTVGGTVTVQGVKTHIALLCQARGTLLPMKETIDSDRSDSSATFSRWGESISVEAPTHVISLAAAESSKEAA